MNGSIQELKSKCGSGEFPIGFIGCGNMAMAIVSGLLKKNLFNPHEILVSGPSDKSLDNWRMMDVVTTCDNREVLSKCRLIVLCVKPNVLNDIIKEDVEPMDVHVINWNKKTLVSILAGTTLETLRSSFKKLNGLNIIRVMPNTPLMSGAGATAITNDERKSHESIINFNVIKGIFKALGIVEVIDESKFHAITGLSGSGPAYVYVMIEALSDAGVKQGLPRELATRFAAQTLFGASKTVLESGFHTGQLKDQVTSPGGTTIHGLHELEKGSIRDTLINAVEAATQRSKEISKN